MSDKPIQITVKEAIHQGYKYFSYGDSSEYQQLYSISNITDADFEDGRTLLLAEKESYYTPSISSEEISETLADLIHCQNNDLTGDDTDEVYDIIKALDFTDAADKINTALTHKKYYKLTQIQLTQ